MKKFLLPLCCIALLSLLAFASPAITYASQGNGLRMHHVCATAAIGYASCSAVQLDARSNGLKPHASSPGGLNPADLQSAYKLPSASAGSGQTIAIVDA
ncbi:MAG TPA: peptidase S8, partial [Ktedonobacteraceae bacterium]|nr:peptidase S8 [Ktedonobacteraceae bacterium]